MWHCYCCCGCSRNPWEKAAMKSMRIMDYFHFLLLLFLFLFLFDKQLVKTFTKIEISNQLQRQLGMNNNNCNNNNYNKYNNDAHDAHPLIGFGCGTSGIQSSLKKIFELPKGTFIQCKNLVDCITGCWLVVPILHFVFHILNFVLCRHKMLCSVVFVGMFCSCSKFLSLLSPLAIPIVNAAMGYTNWMQNTQCYCHLAHSTRRCVYSSVCVRERVGLGGKGISKLGLSPG